MKNLLLLALLALVGAPPALGDSSSSSGTRVLENPVSNGDMKFRVNVGGTKTDVLTVQGSSGQVVMVPSTFTTPSSVGFYFGTAGSGARPILSFYTTDTTSSSGSSIFQTVAAASDTGSNPAFAIDARRDTNISLSVRPIFAISNAGSPQVVVSAAGLVTIGASAGTQQHAVNGALSATKSVDTSNLFITTGTANASQVAAQSGNGTTSGRLAYFTSQSLETTPQRWDAGLFGSKDWTLRDSTNSRSPLVVSAATGGLTVTAAAGQTPLTVSGTSSLIPVISSTGATNNVNLEFDSVAAGPVSQVWRIGPNQATSNSDFEIRDSTNSFDALSIVRSTGATTIGKATTAGGATGARHTVNGRLSLIDNSTVVAEDVNWVTTGGSVGSTFNVVTVNSGSVSDVVSITIFAFGASSPASTANEGVTSYVCNAFDGNNGNTVSVSTCTVLGTALGVAITAPTIAWTGTAPNKVLQMTIPVNYQVQYKIYVNGRSSSQTMTISVN